MKRIADALPGVVIELLRAAPLSRGKVEFVWRMVAGRALERASSVALDEETLVVTVYTRQWAREVHRATPMILRKLERYLGTGVVTAIAVHFGAVGSSAESAFRESPVPESPVPESPIPNPQSLQGSWKPPSS